MITKLRKAQDSWLAKGVLILTALSFMSLFGISGYIDSATGNRAVIKVNNQEINQMDISRQLNEEIQIAQKIFGDLEITDEIRTAMLSGLVDRNLNKMIVQETADQNKVSVSDRQIQGIVFSQPQFIDENGKFNHQQFNYFLSQSGLNQQQYIDNIRHNLEEQYLVYAPVSGFNVPSIMKKYVAQAEAERKIFKYIEINDNDMIVDREISDDEIQQYYEDFSTEFIVPETRDVDFIVLSMDDIAAHVNVSDEDINAYYENNMDQFVKPETRNVLQMVFNSKEEADKAYKALAQGEDFYNVAQKMAGQINEETQLDYVSEDMLLGNLGRLVFTAGQNEIIGPEETEMGWHIMQVIDIRQGTKTDKNLVKEQIHQIIANEKVYETAYDLIANIEDRIGAGSSLTDVAKEMKVKIYHIKGLQENGKVNSLPDSYKELTNNSDFTDMAFSYNQGETSQALETDNGFVFLQVSSIKDSHQQDLADALPTIKKLWRKNEKSAIAQEIVNDVMHDLESGDNITDIANRYHLKITTTSPLTRSESFANLSQAQVLDIFNEDFGSSKLFEQEGIYIIAVTDRQASPRNLTEDDMELIDKRLQLDLQQEAAAAIINSYGQDYDIRIKYRLLGLAD